MAKTFDPFEAEQAMFVVRAPGHRDENVPTFFECGPRPLLVEIR